MWGIRLLVLCTATYVAAVKMVVNEPARIIHCGGGAVTGRLRQRVEEPMEQEQIEEFYSAAEEGNIDYINDLLEKEKGNRNRLNSLLTWHNEDSDNYTALHIAAYNGNRDVAFALLEAGASPNAKDKEDKTPIHYVSGIPPVSGRDTDELILKALLKPEYGADIDQQDARGWTPVFYTARYGQPEVLQVLIEHGADVQKTTFEGWSPLMRAVRAGNIDIVKALIEAGADVDYAAPKGSTALHLAAKNENGWDTNVIKNIIRILLKNIPQNRSYKSTAADLARDADNEEIAEFIENWRPWH